MLSWKREVLWYQICADSANVDICYLNPIILAVDKIVSGRKTNKKLFTTPILFQRPGIGLEVFHPLPIPSSAFWKRWPGAPLKNIKSWMFKCICKTPFFCIITIKVRSLKYKICVKFLLCNKWNWFESARKYFVIGQKSVLKNDGLFVFFFCYCAPCISLWGKYFCRNRSSGGAKLQILSDFPDLSCFPHKITCKKKFWSYFPKKKKKLKNDVCRIP